MTRFRAISVKIWSIKFFVVGIDITNPYHEIASENCGGAAILIGRTPSQPHHMGSRPIYMTALKI